MLLISPPLIVHRQNKWNLGYWRNFNTLSTRCLQCDNNIAYYTHMNAYTVKWDNTVANFQTNTWSVQWKKGSLFSLLSSCSSRKCSLGQLPTTGVKSPPDINKGQLLPTRTTIPKTFLLRILIKDNYCPLGPQTLGHFLTGSKRRINAH